MEVSLNFFFPFFLERCILFKKEGVRALLNFTRKSWGVGHVLPILDFRQIFHRFTLNFVNTAFKF